MTGNEAIFTSQAARGNARESSDTSDEPSSMRLEGKKDTSTSASTTTATWTEATTAAATSSMNSLAAGAVAMNMSHQRSSQHPPPSSVSMGIIEERMICINFQFDVQGAGTVSFEVRTSITGWEMKRSLAMRMGRGLTASSIALVCGDRALPDNSTVEECNIPDGSLIRVVMQTHAGRRVGEAPHAIADVLARLAPLGSIELDIPQQRTVPQVRPPKMSSSSRASKQPGVPQLNKVKKDQIREKAKKLLAKGVAGLVVIPTAGSTKQRVLMLDRQGLLLVKQMREIRQRNGHKCLRDGTDEDALGVINGILGRYENSRDAQEIPEEAASATEAYEEDAASAAHEFTESSDRSAEERAKMQSILEKLKATKHRHHEALRKSNMQSMRD